MGDPSLLTESSEGTPTGATMYVTTSSPPQLNLPRNHRQGKAPLGAVEAPQLGGGDCRDGEHAGYIEALSKYTP